MSNEELYLKEKVGTANHFTVPEGYFEQLTEKIMQQLPEETPQQLSEEQPVAATIPLTTPERRGNGNGGQQPGLLLRLRPWLYAAACIAAVMVMVLTVYFRQSNSEPTVAAATVDSEYMEEAADYAMLDNMDIYACLSDNTY